ncbi:MAG: pilus assembly protein [Chloroflexi bacterium]|nr:pilus assembly protein [Chloroflexota bacterium]
MSHNAQRGQNVIEFALMLPILVLLFAGVVDLSNASQVFLQLTNATEEGTRYATTHPTDSSTVCLRVQQSLPSSLAVQCSNVTISYPGGIDGCTAGAVAVGCPVRVTTTYALTMFMGSVLGFDTIDMSAHVDMIVIST